MESVKVNAIIQSKIDHKILQLGPEKCFKMHIGKQNTNCCPELKTGNEKMLSTDRGKYLGDILSCDGKVDANIEEIYKR